MIYESVRLAISFKRVVEPLRALFKVLLLPHMISTFTRAVLGSSSSHDPDCSEVSDVSSGQRRSSPRMHLAEFVDV